MRICPKKICLRRSIQTRWHVYSQRGLTLIELVISLAVAAIMITGVLLSLGAVERQSLHAASESLAADIRYVQRMAIIESRQWGIHFDPARNEYRVYSTLPTLVHKIVPIPNGVTLVETYKPKLEYLPRGTPSDGFRVTLNKGKYWQQLTVVPSGGRVEVKDILISADGGIPAEAT